MILNEMNNTLSRNSELIQSLLRLNPESKRRFNQNI